MNQISPLMRTDRSGTCRIIRIIDQQTDTMIYEDRSLPLAKPSYRSVGKYMMGAAGFIAVSILAWAVIS